MNRRDEPRASSPASAQRPGRWLFLARAASLALAFLALGLDAISVPYYYARDAGVCASAACVNDSGRLTPERLHALQQMGLSAGFYAAYDTAIEVGAVLVFAAVAAFIFWHRSDDWMALYSSFTLVVFGGAAFNSDLPRALAAAHPVFVLPAQSLDYLGQVCFIVFLYVFPDGRFVPRWGGWLAAAAALLWLPAIFSPHSPFALLNGPCIVGLIGTTVVAQTYRYLKVSSLVQRQQTKWVVFGVVMAIVGFSVMIAISHLFPSVQRAGPPVQMAATALVNGFLLLIPISIGVAMVRSRLYDVDFVINRALVYGLLTISLLLVYFGGVVVLQYAFGRLIGGESQLAVVTSTLAIAALFNPLRRRIQGFIDRRFYRRKYDARKALAAFSAKLRDKTDLDALNCEVVEVVRETMQPAHVSLWLRPDIASKDDVPG